MNTATHHLVLQGPDMQENLAQSMAVLCGARSVQHIGERAFRLREARQRPEIVEVCRGWRIDYAYVPATQRLDGFGLLAMDMDSTLITIECIDELADFAGVKNEVRDITQAAMSGEIDFAESLRRRVALLEGLGTETLERVYAERLQLSPGAEALIARCKEAGIKTLLVSGGFSFFVDRLKDWLGLDYTRSNTLEIRDGKLTGRLEGELLDARGKAAALLKVCAELGIAPARAIVVGDGANDLPMMAEAGVSVAYRAKPIVKQQATYALDHSGLDGVLNLFL